MPADLPCPDPEELARFADGHASQEARDAISAHVDGCAACREVLVTLVRASRPETATGGTLDLSEGPKRGDVIGRYVVLEARGAGGMGLVLSAHDSQLDRKVALKLVRPDLEEGGDTARSRARLLREAQLMARVRHPNVVTVFDVGALGERIFIAMELVDGRTLRDWLKDAPRSWREVLTVLLQAGQALIAAHDAGVVHRDFKPDNVLIDGSVKALVTDFGLAWSDAEPLMTNPTPHGPGAPPVVTGITGTPGYMAPEQRRRGPIDARADQYSFCVTLFEALCGQRPSSAADVRETLRTKANGVPKKIGAALERGLAEDPDARFRSMGALLHALEPQRLNPRWTVAAAGLAVVVAAVTGAVVTSRSDCDAAPAKLRGTWDSTRRAELSSAFAKTQAPSAAAVTATVTRALDTRSQQWAEVWRSTCDAARAKGAPGDETLTRQRGCLDARLNELRALTELFTQPDLAVVENAVVAVSHLKSADGCIDSQGETVLALPAEPPRRAAVANVRLMLAQAEARELGGHSAEALTTAQHAVELATATSYAPVQAEAWLGLVEPLRAAGRYDEAQQALARAGVAAEAGHHYEAQLRVSIGQLRVVDSARTDEAEAWLTRAQAALDQTRQPELAAELDSTVAVLRLAQRRTTEAMAKAQAARGFYERDGRVADALGARHLIALALRARGETDLAVNELEATADAYALAVGPSHPLTLHTRVHIAEAELDRGGAGRALATLDAAPFQSPEALTPSWRMLRERLRGEALRVLGRFDEGLAALRHAIELGKSGTPSPALARLALAATLRDLGEVDAAEHEVLAARSEFAASTRPGPLSDATAQLALAEVRLAQGAPAEALALATTAEAQLRERSEAGAPEHVEALLTLGATLVAAEKNDSISDVLRALQAVRPNGVVAARATLRLGSVEAGEQAEGVLSDALHTLEFARVYPLERLSAVTRWIQARPTRSACQAAQSLTASAQLPTAASARLTVLRDRHCADFSR